MLDIDTISGRSLKLKVYFWFGVTEPAKCRELALSNSCEWDDDVAVKGRLDCGHCTRRVSSIDWWSVDLTRPVLISRETFFILFRVKKALAPPGLAIESGSINCAHTRATQAPCNKANIPVVSRALAHPTLPFLRKGTRVCVQ
jgi:hypothetical protein